MRVFELGVNIFSGKFYLVIIFLFPACVLIAQESVLITSFQSRYYCWATANFEGSAT